MIETLEQTFCRDCSRPITLPEKRGPHPREFCNGTCRKRWQRKHQKPQQASNATIDTMEARINELERQVEELQERLNIEERFRTDIRKRDFKVWLRTHPQPTDTTFFRRFLDDRTMSSEGSRSMYEAKLISHKYSAEDIELFKDAWKRMLFSIP